MTATMGDPKDFLRVIGARGGRYRKIENTFDFSSSPINYWPNHRMSFNEKEKNFPWLVSSIEKILDTHAKESGIIHTGSYDLSKKIFENLRPDLRERVHLYVDSKEKEKKMSNFHEAENSVIMGPSLLEGLDLKNDISRFQVFAKVPYPSLGDKFVRAKMKHSQRWYTWKTVTGILQGTGRSIRDEKDWAITYFLDGCLSDLLRNSRNSFPKEFLERIQLKKEEA
jgi:Rad3-related DNA helicase